MSASVPTLVTADAALAAWRARLAAASRNVVELSELPTFLALKADPGAGRTAEASRGLIATMDELWQGVLLLGAAIDRAAAARQSGSRLWRGEEAAAEAMAILDGESIEIATGDLPVLERGLLASARAGIKVTPQRLLDAMEQGFERAKATIEQLAAARTQFDTVRAELAAWLAPLAAEGWAGAADIQARLDAVEAAADPLGALAQIESVRPVLAAATAQRAAADRDLAAAHTEITALADLRRRLDGATAACRTATDVGVTAPDAAEGAELEAWLDRLTRTRRAGQLDGFRVGLSRWQDLARRMRGDLDAALAVANAALARRDELRGRFGALRAKQAAHAARLGQSDAAAENLAQQLQPLLFGTATRIAEAERLMAQYEATLARPPIPSRSG